MFMVSEDEAQQIREGYLSGGAEGASKTLRRLFAGLVDNEETRASAVAIAGWATVSSGGLRCAIRGPGLPASRKPDVVRR